MIIVIFIILCIDCLMAQLISINCDMFLTCEACAGREDRGVSCR